MTNPQAVKFETPDRGEESARANLYGLLASLFYLPPSQTLLDAIAAAVPGGDGEGVLELAWKELAATCKQARVQQVKDEYESLFISVGKPEVILYGSYYISGFMMEKPLVELRSELARLGLERAETVVEPEDHIASLCEVMRYFITSEDITLASVTAQKSFFAAHLQPWVPEMCQALESHPEARFYAVLAKFARVFFEVESQAFDMA
ncbi:molecular chaperone TorD family protein [Oxalobacteraceae bacterium R-40]|uniref:Molecular chaperone TorD family protein n=1 Tax=Keguizhuia sedimenti TaxID=3064264 RepID=A0ABU1BQ97_9BURK|nr:molecular chaperone TorD family protein [Oxalobacteraceae bacterium R-40]